MSGGVRDALRDRVAALLGISAYQNPKGYGPELDDTSVAAIREAMGGQIQPVPKTKIRWYLADLEAAQAAADNGNLELAAKLWRAMRRDGVISGLLGTRTGGLVRLPKRFYGDEEISNRLRDKNGSRSVFDQMFPRSELALLAGDGVGLGVGIGELVPVPGRPYPVLVRLDPEFLQYRWQENRWYFLSIAGALPITPGNGRWVLHLPGGRNAPWATGLWPALGRSFINKEHAMLHRSNYSAKLANPARAAVAPMGATETQRKGMLRRVIDWGVNTVFELPVGWDVKLIESNGVGFKVFQEEIKTSDEEITIAISGQLVTTTGGTGFSNQDVQKAIRADLIDSDGEGLAYTLNTQGIPPYVVTNFGIDRLETASCVEWTTSTPKDLVVQASSLTGIAGAIKALGDSLAPYERRLRIDELIETFGIPVEGDQDEDGALEEAKAKATLGENEQREAA